MAQSSSYAIPARRRRDDVPPRSSPAVYEPEDFPGCESFHLPASGIDHYEGRLEFWDARTETAWKVCEPTSIQHEGPSRRLVEMATRIAALRGSRIVCFGSADLVRLDAAGRKRWLMQADEVLYLHPDRTRLQGPAIDVDRDPLPDVVLEVDHTTDVRRRKLEIHKESGFPEIWVLVPWEGSARAPGLTIHVRRGEEYREEASSRAFPGWKAEEIHRALTGEPLSAGARRALERVALAMGVRAGTRRRPVHTHDQPEGGGKGPEGDACGERARGAEGPGHRSGLGLQGRSGALRRIFKRGPDGGGAGVYRRGRLPAAGPGAARPAYRDIAVTCPGPRWQPDPARVFHLHPARGAVAAAGADG